ncbi:MAG: LptF/LptG family permease, partial [Vicinamibacterales bacterium]
VMLYAQEVALDGSGWAQVFLADTSKADQPTVYLAERGRVAIDRENRTIDVVLEHGTGHRSDPSVPGEYEVHEFEELVIGLNAETAFPRSGPQRGLAELTIPQLETEAATMASMGQSAHQPIMHIHRKFSIPFACLVFALLGVGFGVTSRKDGRLASFALGIGVIFAYYVVMYTSEAMAKGQLVSPHLAMWIPNVLLGFAGMLLIVWRSRSVERRFRFPFLSQRDPHRIDVDDGQSDDVGRGTAPLVELSPGKVFGVKLLDWYVTRFYLTWVFLAFVGLLGIFYIATFIDLSDKLFKGQTTGLILLEYFWYATPQFMYYVLPISALVSTLITVGALTKTSELTVMKACGISLYRMAFPIFMFSLVWSGCLFLMSETFLSESNRRAEDLNHVIRTGLNQTVDVLNRRWLVTETGDIYHYLNFDPDEERLMNLSVYEFSDDAWSLDRRTYAAAAAYRSDWEGENVWTRDFDLAANTTSYEMAPHQTLAFLSPPDFFVAEAPEADLMSYQELSDYIVDLSERGFDVVSLVVDLHRKLSFPFVTFILTLIAVPFAVTTGPRGALYGVGVGIGIAFSYWIILSVFGAFGSAGVLAPALAAWAPNLLFGASAGYFLLTVRT